MPSRLCTATSMDRSWTKWQRLESKPFEAVRTRPFHYRCFNLEAMIVRYSPAVFFLLSPADSLDKRQNWRSTWAKFLDQEVETWRHHTRRSQLRHVCRLERRKSRPDCPHTLRRSCRLMAILVANTRNTWTRRTRTIVSKSYWFYDQPGALAGSSQKKRSVEWRREETSDNNSPCESDLPVAFQRAFCVELEDGLCVTWEQLKILFCLIAI